MKTSTFSIIRVATICVGMLSLIILSSCTSQPTENATKVKIGDLYYALDTADMTATIISPWSYYSDDDDVPGYTMIINGYVYSYPSYGSQEYQEASRIYREHTTIEIPASIDYKKSSYRVTGIFNGVFTSCPKLKAIHVHKDNPSFCSVDGVLFNKDTTALISYPRSKSGAYSIPVTVNAINAYAFEACTKLTAINIPNSVTSIGYYAFNECSCLTSVTIPGSVTIIDSWTFAECDSLTSVTIGNGVTSIESHAFRQCRNLTSVTLPSSVTSIKDCAFAGCCTLTSIEIPDNVLNIEDFAFSGAPNITYHGDLDPTPWGVKCINGYIDGCFVYSDEKKTTLCACLASATGDIVIPESVTHIKNRVFSECRDIRSVTVPSNVIEVDYAFCYYVPNIIYHGSLDTSEWGAKVVNGFVDGNLVYNDDTRTEVFACVTNAEEIVVPESVQRVRTDAFFLCDQLKAITWNAINCADFDLAEDLDEDDLEHYEDFNIVMLNEHNNVTSFVIGDRVEHIPALLCYMMHGVQSISIPNSVKSIGRGAFIGCSGAKSVTIGSNVTTMGYGVFGGCDSLRSFNVAKANPAYCSVGGVLFNKDQTTLILYPKEKQGAYRIPKSVTKVEEGAFYACTGLTSIKVPEGFTTIDDHMFAYCTNLRSVKLPNSLERIEENAFYQCSNLISVTIPENVTSIGGGSFEECNNLSSFTLNAKNCADFQSSEDTPFRSVSDEAEVTLSSFVFGDKVEHIPAYMCYGMHNLNSITIPASVTSIGKEAFDDCKSLTSVVWNAKNCADFEIDSYSPFFGSPVTSFVLGKEVRHIPVNLCTKLSDITSIIIPKRTTSIGNFAFWSCSNLTSVYIPESVEDLGYGTFCGCYKMESIDVSEKNPNYCSIDGIVYNKDQTTLTHYPSGRKGSFSFPNSLTSFGKYAFSFSNLSSITMSNDNVEEIGAYAFRGCRYLSSVKLSPNLAKIGEGAFSLCSYIDSIELPNTLSVIEDYAFYCCDSLKYIMIPDSVTSIGHGVFWNCKNITSAKLPDSITVLSDDIFYGCESLKSITIPESVTSIGEWAFTHAYGLKKLTIPSNVKSIGALAFNDCINLKSITCMAQTPPDMGVQYLENKKENFGVFYVIENNGSDIPLYVPAGSVNAYKKADQWKDFKNILPIKD